MEDETVVHDNNDADVRENNDLDDDVRNRSFKNRVRFHSDLSNGIDICG